jgi:hypothetical protein
MACRISVAILTALLLMCGSASAQVAMGAAPPPGVRFSPPPAEPETPPANPDPRPYGHQPKPHQARDVTTGRDVFLAGPHTYRPRRDAFPSVVPFGFYPGPAVPEVVFVERVTPPVVVERTKVVYVEKPVEREPAVTSEPPAAPPRIVAPKTLYVIPRCYAGDKPPAARDLPAGCDIRDMRIIPAR